MPIRAREIQAGGWLEIPGVIAGRVVSLYSVPGTVRSVVTLESGEQVDIGWDERVVLRDG